ARYPRPRPLPGADRQPAAILALSRGGPARDHAAGDGREGRRLRRFGGRVGHERHLAEHQPLLTIGQWKNRNYGRSSRTAYAPAGTRACRERRSASSTRTTPAGWWTRR